MDQPYQVGKAINLIWVLIGLSVLIILINKWTGEIHSGEFIFGLLVNAIYCMIPFKLSSRSNAARYVFTVLVVLSALVFLGGAVEMLTKLDLIFGLISMPLYIFCVYLLFTQEASAWFTNMNQPTTKDRIEPKL